MDGARELCESLGRIKEETRRSEIALFHAGTKRAPRNPRKLLKILSAVA
jgi:hypothetical protein